jgi:hypothetical protein
VLLALPGHAAFVGRGLGKAPVGAAKRLGLALKLVRIHLVIPCPHAPLELLHVVEHILDLPPTIGGAVVECGSYLGGSSAKLSHAAALTGRHLFVCDSFAGLPEVAPQNHLEGRASFRAGDFAAGLGRVRRNLGRYGNPAVVEFVPGWYPDSLARLAGVPIACLFLDVDLEESVRACLSVLWPRVRPGCKVFVHDVDRPPVVEPFADRPWWSNRLGSPPPPFTGRRTGLGPHKRLLGYAVKL